MSMRKSPPDHEAWWSPFALAVALGTLAGLTQVAVVSYRRHVDHVFTWTSRDIAWMSPLANVAVLVVPALFVTLLRIVRPAWASRVVVELLALGAAVSLLLNIRTLHPVATMVLATGIAVQLGRFARAHPVPWARWMPRLAGAGVMATLLVSAIVGRRHVPETRGVAGSDAPNVVLLILDTVRAASTSLHGYARSTTPTMERLAGEGMRFEWAIAPSSWTLPSHASMFTGRTASTLSASWRTPLDATHPTLAEVLAGHGYTTGAFVANLFYTHHESGVDRGFQELRDYRRSRLQLLWSTTFGQTPLVDAVLWGEHTPRALLAAFRRFDLRARTEPQSDRRRATEVIDEFLVWQGRSRGPFFAFLNLYDAHDPYESPPGYDSTFAARPTRQDMYDAGIRYMDDQVNRLLRTLEARGVLDRTLVVVTSDHGEQWGEHGLVNHGNSLYLPAVHVPLVIRLPARARAGERVTAPVSLTNLAATVLDAVGITDVRIPGQSLLDPGASHVVTETEALDPSARARSPAEHGPLSSIVQDSLQYFRNGDGTYQLFNVRRDYGQVTDLLTTAAWCLHAVVLDSILRTVSQQPATPPFTPARCTARMPQASTVGAHP